MTGERPNIRENYGDRFRVMFGYKNRQDFFLYAGQFGHGIVLWDIACREADKPTGNKLSEAPWMARGCGPGSKNLAADNNEGEQGIKAAV